MSAPIVFLDTETTGLHADRRPWEIAMIRRDGRGERELLIQVDDVDLTDADQKGLEIGGFYQRHLRYETCVPMDDREYVFRIERDAAELVEQWTRGAHIVGVNPAFDAATIAAMFRRHRLAPSWHYHLIDVPAMALGWLHGIEDAFGDGAKHGNVPGLPWRSYQLSEDCDVPPPSDDEKHTALGDARWTARWYDQLTGGTK